MNDRRLESARTPDGPGPEGIDPPSGPDHPRVVLGTTPGPLQDQDHWEERLRAAVAKTIAARRGRSEIRATLNARRAVGLDRRHATKLARNTNGDTP